MDSNHKVFSSEGNILIGDIGDDLPVENFIAMDPPRHDIQRRAVQPVVAPQNLAQMEALIRQRVCDILDGLPIGEEIDWVDIELDQSLLFHETRKAWLGPDVFATGLPDIGPEPVCVEFFVPVPELEKQRRQVIDAAQGSREPVQEHIGILGRQRQGGQQH